MENINKFGERLLKLREEREETQQQLADAIGITRQSLSRYETNERTPNIDLIFKVAKHYNISADYLLGLSEIKSSNNKIQNACEVTGLEETAIDVLKKRKTECKGCRSFDENFYTFNILVSLLISNEHFNTAIHYLCGCLNLMNVRNTVIKNTVSDNRKIKFKIFDNGYSMVTIDEHTDYYKYLISNCLDNSIRDIIQSYENNIYKERKENGKHNDTEE